MRVMQVPRWQTSDGGTWDNRQRAVEHECVIQMTELLQIDSDGNLPEPADLWCKRGEMLAIYAQLETPCLGEEGYVHGGNAMSSARAYVGKHDNQAAVIIMQLAREIEKLRARVKELEEQR